ncbi:hypothetical protein [Thermosipho atlanticus]|uniref:Uncharacterized protein n=1 Tax=Thermosipho atlanticus DSM 15807 TaxID=1123380 RepID=A0A1M5R3E4_9BACT|nr:hypothetical protein [Thermosipho atlanticus]SHH20721.1 hypothetical protein SAMN02745199_0308 [Thermosipho atlanticus DSM 15807]
MKRFMSIIYIFIAFIIFANIPLFIGTMEKNGEKYFVYEISPEFSFGPVTLGIGFTTYATDVVYGTFYYGLPSTHPSTNIINGFIINSLELNLDTFKFRYGKARPLTFGLGFNVRNYVNPNTRALDVSLKFDKFGLKVHVPYELQSFIPFSFVQSDSVYMGEFVSKFGMFDLEVSGAVDLEASNTFVMGNGTPVQYAGSIALVAPVMIFKIGIETAFQANPDFTKIGKGIFAGLYGKFGSAMEYTAGVFYTIDGFIPKLFDRNYASLKLNNSLPSLDEGNEKGYLVGFNIYLEPYGNGMLYLLGTLDGSLPIMEGRLRLNLPSIGSFNGLLLRAYYYDETPFMENKFFDSSSDSWLEISYPIIGMNFVAGVRYTWEETKWAKSIFVGSSVEF